MSTNDSPSLPTGRGPVEAGTAAASAPGAASSSSAAGTDIERQAPFPGPDAERLAAPAPSDAALDTLAQPWPAPDLRITGVRTVATAPEGIDLLVVQVDTNEPGLYGLGCATFTQRHRAVAAYVQDYLAPLVVGRYPGDIEDLRALARHAGYWREGPVGNNAVSGLDMALWDIAGKRSGLPVHELLGGRARAAIDTYIHAGGATIPETLDEAHRLVAAGWRHVRLQVSAGGIGAYGGPPAPSAARAHPGAPYPAGWDPRTYSRHETKPDGPWDPTLR